MDWRRSLELLRARFDAAAGQHPRVFHVVMELRDGRESADTRDQINRWLAEGPPSTPKATQPYKLGLVAHESPRRCVIRPSMELAGVALGFLFAPATDHGGVSQLLSLAGSAGSSILKTPELAALKALVDLRRDDFGHREADFWFLALHRLAWSGLQPAIPSTRWMWAPDQTGELRRDWRVALSYKTPEELAALKGVPAYAAAAAYGDRYYAVLDLDVFTASSLGCQALVDLPRPSTHTLNEHIRRSLEQARASARAERAVREEAAKVEQLARPLSPTEAVEQLRALAAVPPSQRLHSVYDAAGMVVLKMVRQGQFLQYPRAREHVVVHDALPNGPSLIGIWSDFSGALREARGLPTSGVFDTFSQDAELVASLISSNVRIETRCEDANLTGGGPSSQTVFKGGDGSPSGPEALPIIGGGHGGGAARPPATDGPASGDAQLEGQARIALTRQTEDCAHGADFTWVRWYGNMFSFKKGNQASAIQCLWEEWEKSGRQDGCGLGDESIAESIGAAETNFRIPMVFRDHPAFGTMIRSVGKGVHALFSLAPERPQPKKLGSRKK